MRKSAKLLPAIEDVQERRERLSDRRYVNSAQHQAQKWLVWHERAEWPREAAFEEMFVRLAARQGIPMYCSLMDHGIVRMEHGIYGSRLHSDDWVIVGAIGADAAKRAHVKVSWTGSSIWNVLPVRSRKGETKG